MSERKFIPADIRILLFSVLIGVMVTAGGLAGMAALMVSREISGSAAVPLATAATGTGSFFSGWFAAFCKREHGLIWGALQGLVLAALLFILALPAGVILENAILLRFAVMILCGSIGGFCGVSLRGRKHLS